MKKLKADLDRLKALLEEKNPAGAEALRASEVNELWQRAVSGVFESDAAALVLDHTNSVYVMSGEQGGSLKRFERPRSEIPGPVRGKILVVYCDDSIVRSELDNRQELLKMIFKKKGEDIEALRILPSTRDMKNRHPFRDKLTDLGTSNTSFVRPSRITRALTEEELATIHKTTNHVENPVVKRALYRAFIASATRSDNEVDS